MWPMRALLNEQHDVLLSLFCERFLSLEFASKEVKNFPALTKEDLRRTKLEIKDFLGYVRHIAYQFKCFQGEKSEVEVSLDGFINLLQSMHIQVGKLDQLSGHVLRY